MILNWFLGFKKKWYFLGIHSFKAVGGGRGVWPFAERSAKITTFFLYVAPKEHIAHFIKPYRDPVHLYTGSR